MSDRSVSLADLKQQQDELRRILLLLLDGVNQHQIILGHLFLGDREAAAKELTQAGDVIRSAVERIGTLIEATA